MSQWTHVAGIIRLDNMGVAMVMLPTETKHEKIIAAVKKALGNTCDYESGSESWEQCSVPRGSEGSLQYRVFRNSDRDDNALSWGYVSIWGDLRDVGDEDVPGIVDWFQKSLEKLGKPDKLNDTAEMTNYEKADYMLSSFMIRDAVLSIGVEYSQRTILLWDDEKKKVCSIQQRT